MLRGNYVSFFILKNKSTRNMTKLDRRKKIHEKVNLVKIDIYEN